MRIFISAGEPSGDLHGANLVQALRHLDPTIEFDGFGGDRMEAAGCRLLYPLCQLAVVGVRRVLANVHHFYRLLGDAGRFFRDKKPDAVVLIDYPGFNWWVARRAHENLIPVYYFVPPQLWAWAGWRARKMRRLVDHVLCTLPFEETWYRRRHIPAQYIGHPFFDELREQQLDPGFMAGQRARRQTIVGLLPGSRNQEVENNLGSLLRAAALIHARRPDVRFLVACLRPAHKHQVEDKLQGIPLPVEVHAGKTPEIIALAHSCIAVSGSVSLELLFRACPSVITYQSHLPGILCARMLLTCPYICLVNLLAGQELFPEYLTYRCEAERMAGHVLHWLENPAVHRGLVVKLETLRDRVAEPGACQRAAAFLLDSVGPKQKPLAA
jgi:lipid-A-disaccharide synthase